MALSLRLNLRPGQSLVMTPKLQQAIKLLQLSNLELSELVKVATKIVENQEDFFRQGGTISQTASVKGNCRRAQHSRKHRE